MYDLDSGNLKMAENFYLASACENKNGDDLAQFVAMRNARARIMGREAVQAEQTAETKAGLARYAHLLTLPRADMITEVAQHLTALRDPQTLLHPQEMAKNVGTILCFALKNLGIDFEDNGQGLFDFVPKTKNAVEKLLDTSPMSPRA